MLATRRRSSSYIDYWCELPLSLVGLITFIDDRKFFPHINFVYLAYAYHGETEKKRNIVEELTYTYTQNIFFLKYWDSSPNVSTKWIYFPLQKKYFYVIVVHIFLSVHKELTSYLGQNQGMRNVL